jgi:SAM-dependent methyltransferase
MMCPSCRCTAFVNLGKRTSHASISGYAPYVADVFKFDRDVLECALCGLQYIHPMYNSGDFKALYEGELYESFKNNDCVITNINYPGFIAADIKKFRLAELGDYAESFERRHGRRAELLEVGCGEGWHMDALSQIGFSVSGIDLNDKFIANIKKRYGFPVEKKSLEEMSGDRKYDAVAALHVIEHLDTPNILFEKAREILQPDGILIIETPFITDFGKSEERFRDIYHTLFFKPFSLWYAAAHNGFAISAFLLWNYPDGAVFNSNFVVVAKFDPLLAEVWTTATPPMINWVKPLFQGWQDGSAHWIRGHLRHQKGAS